MIENLDDDAEIEFEDQSETEESDIDEIPKEKRILRTQAYDKSVSDLISMMDEDIRLDPHYQRSYIWDNKKASLLVESILLNVPIPVVYVEEDEESRWNVVDGLQRLNSLKRFFNNEFKLSGLEVLPELNRLQYSTLPPKAQRILKNGILRIIVILQESHPEIKYDIFLRLNRGAVRLNEQELRNCLYRGSLNDFIKELREDEKFQSVLGLERPHPRFVDAELLLRAVALVDTFDIESGLLRGYPGKMKSFLNSYMNDNKHVGSEKLKELKEVFLSCLNCSIAVFGEKAFRRIDPISGASERQINRALFDTIMVGFSAYSLAQVTKKKDQIFSGFMDLSKSDKVFADALIFGTSDKSKVEYRLSTWTSFLKKIIV
ncbi:DUF262 domain-containing protein [Herbaspirillum huttiense]|uniref:DUF262 domain-containing protein n=1 Tax=Herbaspirillum huttiense TaxID=863372 RepID=UPI0037F1C034